MDPIILAVLAAVYLLAFPLLVRLSCLLHRRTLIARAEERVRLRKIDPDRVPKPWWPKIKERIGFTFKDKRATKIGKKEGVGPQRRIVFFVLWLIGLALFVAAPLATWHFYLAGVVFFLFALGFGLRSPHDVIVTRERIYNRMFDIGRSKLSIPGKYEGNPKAVVTVVDWNEYIKPVEVRFMVPTTFGQEGEEGFLRQFNQVFGSETAWVPKDDPDKGTSGWNYEKGEVTLRAVPPLPQSANFSEHYITDPAIAWSFFPIALGVENGVELKNPETGEVENVLGFDFSGNQAKLGKKMGVKVTSKLASAAPMVLIGGGTGGGKSLAIDTPVYVYPQSPLGAAESDADALDAG